MFNYNKVKNEGVESLPKYKNGSNAIPKSEIVIPYTAVKSFLSTYAEKIHKATLEDVLEFLGEDIEITDKYKKGIPENIGVPVSSLRGINKERQRIRDYIKTLTK